MKKIVSLLLALCLACMLIPAMAEIAAETVTGEWFAIEMVQGDMSINPATMGMTITLALNEDGTMALTMAMGEESEAQEGTWEIVDGKIILTAGEEDALDTLEIVMTEDGNLSADDDGTTMVFSREASGAGAVEFAEVNPDALAEDFNGEWEFAYLSIMGMTLDAETAIAMGALDEMGTVGFQDGVFTVSGTLEMMLSGMTLTYADGAYSYVIALGDSSMGIYVYLLQDGMMKLVIDMGEQMELYFVKAEPAE